MMKIYIIRHGETQWNTERRMQGWGNSDLTELGTSQAKLLGKSLANIDFDQVITSPLGRTLETTKLIVGNRDLDVVINENFKEMGFGPWEGENPNVLKEQYPDQYYNFWHQAHNYGTIEGGESFVGVQKRIAKGMEHILDTHGGNPDSKILLVTHGMIIKLLLLHIKGLPLEKLWDSSVVHASSLTIVEVDGEGNMTVVVENDVGHLED